jgi:hypothetical protein
MDRIKTISISGGELPGRLPAAFRRLFQTCRFKERTYATAEQLRTTNKAQSILVRCSEHILGGTIISFVEERPGWDDNVVFLRHARVLFIYAQT